MKADSVNKKIKVLKEPKQKVFVGMSGGVDSSVSAALLKEAGYDVTGVFIKVWSPDWLPCDWKEERRDAMRCAAVLEIPLLTFDFEKEYKEGVVDYMISEYKAGRIPNPDVMCNKTVKFGSFFNKAMKMGADFVATGHYARVSKSVEPNTKYKILNTKYSLLAGKDTNKDQSYFLWTIGQRQLSKTFFPVGDIEKDEVRKLAEKFGLPTARKKDSQGLCFLGKIDVKDFLRRYIKEKKGKVLNEKGEVIGEHDGVVFYSMGERHGFNIVEKDTNRLPYYVISKDVKKNIIVVSHNKLEQKSLKKEIEIKDINLITDQNLEENKKYSARIRYREELKTCLVKTVSNKKLIVIFDEPEDSVASGQSLVIYDGEICLGGGIIV
ncbi:MAG: tRNA 2-thiouridine(34) synthase MnmA [bacterium]